jgi:REP element-mobilizing transposase RayT
MHSFVNCLVHCVWATKERRPFIKADLQQRLWPYLGGVARENRMKALVVGGVEDHVHVLLSIPSTLSVSKCIQLLKGNSSKWIHDTFKEHWGFEWQEGYGAFRRPSDESLGYSRWSRWDFFGAAVAGAGAGPEYAVGAERVWSLLAGQAWRIR